HSSTIPIVIRAERPKSIPGSRSSSRPTRSLRTPSRGPSTMLDGRDQDTPRPLECEVTPGRTPAPTSRPLLPLR
ncbi:hypothetical protein CH063_13291, partial [Colletotrichum higginsianum]